MNSIKITNLINYSIDFGLGRNEICLFGEL